MSAHPAVARLYGAGFDVVPVLNLRGGDTGVLAWRCDPNDLVVVTAWSDDFAVAARLPPDRDWSEPFVATTDNRLGPARFADVVEHVLGGRHRLLDLRDAADGADFVHLVRGAR